MRRERTSITFETKKEIAATVALLQLFENLHNRVSSPNTDQELFEILHELKKELVIMEDLFFK